MAGDKSGQKGKKGRRQPGKFLNNPAQDKLQGNKFKPLETLEKEEQSSASNGVFISFSDVLDQLDGIEGKEKMAKLAINAVQTAVQAAIPAVIQAVKDACLMKEDVNPHLLRAQFKHDELDQNMRRENLRITGLPESQEESEEALIGAVVKVAKEAGVELAVGDLDTCHRLGSPPKPTQNQPQNGKEQVKPKPRQTFIRFSSRKKRDQLYDNRFKLKGNESCKGVFINEDLTSMRYKVLMAAKKAPDVKGVTSKHGNVICKMNDDSYKTLRSADDLFDVGITNVKYDNFGLHVL